ncbi:MAG: hypothetical protein QF738_03650 [Rhodospirillales bacterium]|nr:hypothetical protein [Rhodospirillales bacterium]
MLIRRARTPASNASAIATDPRAAHDGWSEPNRRLTQIRSVRGRCSDIGFD